MRAKPDTLWQRTLRAVGRHRQRVLTGILALIAVAAIGAMSSLGKQLGTTFNTIQGNMASKS